MKSIDSMGMTGKPWEAGEREPYAVDPAEVEGEKGLELEKQRALEFRQSMQNYLAARDKRQGVAKQGADLGKSIIRYCQVKNLNGTEMVNESGSQVSAVVRSVDSAIRKLLPAFEAEGILSGFHLEFGAAEILAQHMKLPLYFPSDKPGTSYEEGQGIDWWVDMGGKEGYPFRGMPIQVKSVPFRSGTPNQVLYFVKDIDEAEKLVTTLITPDRLDPDVKAHAIDKLQTNIYNSTRKMLDYSDSRFNDTAPAVMLMPSRTSTSFSEYSDDFTGGTQVNLHRTGIKPLTKNVQKTFLDAAKNREETELFTEKFREKLESPAVASTY